MGVQDRVMKVSVEQLRVNRLNAEAARLTDKLYDAWAMAPEGSAESERLKRLVGLASRRAKRRLRAKLPWQSL
jgi:hypothetical protein